jgi:general secretion pathway protein A
MDYKFFGLSGPPFEFGSSPNTLFMSTPHREALSALEWGVAHETSGFTMLVGETGTGKTTLVNALLAQHHEYVRAVYVLNPRRRIREILNPGRNALNLEFRPERFGLWHEIAQTVTQMQADERILVIVDDAQDLNDECVEDLRRLSNYEAYGNMLLRFLLVGQPELLTRLKTPKLYDINERIGARAKLNPLKFDEACSYVDCRLRQQGGSVQKLFDAAALRHLIAYSKGIPHRINLLCNSAMLAAYADGTGQVTVAAAHAAVADYESRLESTRTSTGRFGLTAASFRIATWSMTAIAAVGLVAAAPVVYLALTDGSAGPQTQPGRSTMAISAAPPQGANAEKPASPISNALRNQTMTAADSTINKTTRLSATPETSPPAPGHARVLDGIRRGEAYMQLGQYDNAIREFQTALHLEPARRDLRDRIKRALKAKAAEESILS